MKKLKYLKFYTSGGLCDKTDLHGTVLEFTISEDLICCNLSLMIGDLFISKVFKNDEYKVLDNVISLLNSCDFNKLNTDYNRMMIMDLPDNIIEYSYDDYDKLTRVKNPNSRGILQLLNDFMINYLLKDSELISIFSAIINNNIDVDYLSLRHIINDDNIFDINRDYNLNELEETMVDVTIQNKGNDSNNNVSINELINEINKRIEAIDKL